MCSITSTSTATGSGATTGRCSCRRVSLAADLPGTGGTWVNRRLQYTHGFGLVMTPAADKTPGRAARADGQGPAAALAAGSADRSRPRSTTGRRTRATASSPRVSLSSITRAAMRTSTRAMPVTVGCRSAACSGASSTPCTNSTRTSSLSNYITADSRIQFWRAVRDRVGRIAPFLRLDSDPYLVVDRGRLFWIQDAYTTASGYPYAEPVAKRLQLHPQLGQGRDRCVRGRCHLLRR